MNYDLHYLAPGPAGTAARRAESVRMGQQIVVMQVWVEDAQGVPAPRALHLPLQAR